MTIFNREDYRTVIPQLEKRITALENAKQHSPWAVYYGYCSTSVTQLSDTQVWHTIPDFVGATQTYYFWDTDYFDKTDNRGIVIKKHGVYRLSVVTHFNGSGSNNWAIRFYDYKKGAQVGIVQYSLPVTGYSSIANGVIAELGRNTTIAVQGQRYSGSNAWRFSLCDFTIELIQEL